MFHNILQSFIKLLFLCPLCWTFCKIYLIMFTRTGIPSLWTSNSACLWKCEACHEIFNSQPLGTPWDVHFKTEILFYSAISNYQIQHETSVIKKTHTILLHKSLPMILCHWAYCPIVWIQLHCLGVKEHLVWGSKPLPTIRYTHNLTTQPL